MTIRTQQDKVFFGIVMPVPIAMVYFNRNLTGNRMALMPTAPATLFTILLDQVALNVIGQQTVLVSNT